MNDDNETIMFRSYEKFGNLVRTWLVTYGVGAIVFLSSQETIVKALKGNPESKCIVTYFLIGIGLQVFSALLYKYTMGVLYHAEADNNPHESCREKLFSWISESFLLEAAMDFATIYVYIQATYRVANIVIT